MTNKYFQNFVINEAALKNIPLLTKTHSLKSLRGKFEIEVVGSQKVNKAWQIEIPKSKRSGRVSSLLSTEYMEDQVIVVSEPEITRTITSLDRKIVFRACDIILVESCDLSWLSLTSTGHVELADCNLYKIQDTKVRASAGVNPESGLSVHRYSIPDNQLLTIAELLRPKGVRSIEDMPYCWLCPPKQEYTDIEIELEGQVWHTRKDLLLGYCLLKRFLYSTNSSIRHYSPLDALGWLYLEKAFISEEIGTILQNISPTGSKLIL